MLLPPVPSCEGLEVHAQGIDGEEDAGASQQLVNISSELTVKDYVEGSICVSGHHESHNCYEAFGCRPRRVLESLSPVKFGSGERKRKQRAADDGDYYVSFVDCVVHGQNAGTLVGRSLSRCRESCVGCDMRNSLPLVFGGLSCTPNMPRSTIKGFAVVPATPPDGWTQVSPSYNCSGEPVEAIEPEPGAGIYFVRFQGNPAEIAMATAIGPEPESPPIVAVDPVAPGEWEVFTATLLGETRAAFELLVP